MHNNKLVVAIKNKGEVLKEFKDEIRIPFGAEYSIYIKNLNTVRALVSISIDGQDIGDGTKFIVQPNSSVEIERFIKNGNFDEGNRLKFIERNAKVEAGRGVKAEDGLVRVEFQFEKVSTIRPQDFGQYLFEKKEVHHHHHYPHRWYLGSPYYGSGSLSGGTSGGVFTNSANMLRSRSATKGASGSTTTTTDSSSETYDSVSAQASNFMSQDNESIAQYSAQINCSAPVNETGITVEGSVSEQKFQTGDWFQTETESYAIVLRLVGDLGNKKVVQAVTVKAKQKCKTCKHVNKVAAKFCSECGTSLTIV